MSDAQHNPPPAALLTFFRMARQLAQEARRAEEQAQNPALSHDNKK